MISMKRGGALSKLKFVFCAGILLVVSACSEYEEVNKAVDKNEKTIDRAFQNIMPKQKTLSPLVVDDRPWFGSNAVPMLNGSPLPPAYQRRNALVMTFTEPVSMRRATQMVQSVTGIRVQIGQNVFSDGPTGQDLAGDLFLPVDGEQVTGGRTVWQGRLSDLLDQISDHFGADWSYDGRVIRFASEVTRTFMLHALSTEIGTSDDVTGNDAEGSNLPGMSLNSSVDIDIWGEIEEAIGTIVGTQGEAVFSPSTGTITVTGNPEVVRRVETYLNQQNQMRLRRVSIAVKVLDVALANGYNVTTSATGLIARILEGVSGNLGLGSVLADGSTIGGVLTLNQNFNEALEDDFETMLSMSELVDRVTIVHSGSVVTLSDQPAPLQVGRQIAYLARISSTAGDTGQVSLEPDTVTEGLTMIVLPRILDRNRILMRLAVSIIDAEEPFTEFGGGADGLAIQLPEIATTGFLQNAFMNTGETMVLAGFERKQDSYNDTGTPGGLFTGGSRTTNRSRNITVLLLSAEILPEYNMTVINH